MLKCWIHKLRAFGAGHQKDGHVAGCPQCAEEERAVASIEERLRNSVPRAEIPFGFTNRVFSRIARGPEREPRAQSFPWMRMAMGTGFILLGSFVIHKTSTKPATEPVLAAQQGNSSRDVVFANLPRISSQEIGQLTVRLDQPLETELQSVISDTRQAIQFVASNFIPEPAN